MGSIISIGTANPEYFHKQENIKEFMMSACAEEDFESRQKINVLHSRSSINSRYSVLSDYSLSNKRNFYSESSNLQPMPGLEQRMELFKRFSLPLSVKAIGDCINKLEGFQSKNITHIITVTCTGLSAPGLDFAIIKELNLNPQTERHTVNFMGCYAAIQALKLANHICNSDRKAKILLVATELCTLHFQNNLEEDQLISNSLFSDGSAAMLIVADKEKYSRSITIKDFFSSIIFEGEASMGWEISESGFLMNLKPTVPAFIKKSISEYIQNALKHYDLDFKEISHWAVHPGGKKILEVIECELGLGKEQIRASYNILNQYGNMSSPSIIYVLKDLWDNYMNDKKREIGVMMAFGPGLTMESVLFSNE